MIRSIFLFCIFFFSPLFAQNQTENKPEPPKKEETNQPPAQQNIPSQSSETPSLDSFFTGTQGAPTTDQVNLPSPEIPSAWGPFFFLLFVAISLFYGIKYFKKRIYLKNILNSPIDFIKTVITVPVTPQASLAIIEINKEYFIFSVTSTQIHLVQKIEDPSLILQIKTVDGNKGVTKTFRDIITSFFQVKVEKKINPNISTQEIQSFVKQQKDRLDKLNDK